MDSAASPENNPEDITVTLACSMSEFYNGALKTFHYSRDVLMPDGKNISSVDEQMTIELKPGYDVDTVLTFPSKGHQAYAA